MLWLENGVWRVDNECWVDREGQVKGCNGKELYKQYRTDVTVRQPTKAEG